MRRIFPVLAFVSWLAGCSDESAGEVDGGGPTLEIGIIDHFGDSEGILVAPETVEREAPFSVEVITYARGCYVADVVEVESSSEVVTLTPYDRRLEGDVCTDGERRLSHSAELAFATPGSRTIEIVGRKVDADEDLLIRVSTDIVVE